MGMLGQNNTLKYHGQPNIGSFDNNGGFAPPWPDWGTFGNPGLIYQETDTNVVRTIYYYDNYLQSIASGAMENTTGFTKPDSIYLTAKPSWWGTLPWPPEYSAKNNATHTWNTNTLQTVSLMPAQVRYFALGSYVPGVTQGSVVRGNTKVNGNTKIK
jgi:hypothetical protein